MPYLVSKYCCLGIWGATVLRFVDEVNSIIALDFAVTRGASELFRAQKKKQDARRRGASISLATEKNTGSAAGYALERLAAP